MTHRRTSAFLATLIAFASQQCGNTTNDDTRENIGTSREALTTPTGATWTILPRPPARVTPMFNDAYVAPFIAEGWSATATPQTTTKTEGTTALAVNLTAGWSAYGVGIDWSQAPYLGASQTEVSFAFNAGATVNAALNTLQLGVEDDDAATPWTFVNLKPYLVATGNIAASTWYRVTVPMSVLNPSNALVRRFVIFNNSSVANVPFFVDDLKMSWTDAAPTPRDIYSDVAAPSFAVGGWTVTNSTSTFRTTGANASLNTFTGSWGAATYTYDWNLPAFAANAFTHVSFDISGGSGTPAAALASMLIGLDTAPTKSLVSYIPGGFKANTWHHVTIPIADLTTAPFRMVTFKNNSTSTFPFYVDQLRFETDHTPPPLRDTTPPPQGDPDTFGAGEVDVVSLVRTAEGRKAISPLIYGMNDATGSADVMRAITLVRRGGDRSNANNWETNVSNGSYNNNFSNDMFLAGGLANPNAPAAVDIAAITANRAAGRASMVPFVLNDYVSGPVSANIPYSTVGWDRTLYFKRVQLVKTTPFLAAPDTSDDTVYTDEHLDYMRRQFAGDIYNPGATQVLVGIDNEPDLYHYNFPMLQAGTGEPLYAQSGQQIGTRVSAQDFITRMNTFAKRVKDLEPQASIVGPCHYNFDGFTTWHQLTSPYSATGRWFMDDFLAGVKTASDTAGKRLLDTFDFHWYPQRVSNGVPVWNLDHASRALTAAEVDSIVQGPRSYWDPDYNEASWITDQLGGGANILTRLSARIATGYPGTNLGVSEYFPGGRNHISSGLAVADSLGVFATQSVQLAALWQVGGGGLDFAYGGLRLMRNADNAGLGFASTLVKVEHPEKAESSLYAASDTTDRVTVLVVNKTNAARSFGVRAFNAQQLKNVAAYRIDATHSAPFLASNAALTKYNAYAYAAPAMSATLLVFTK